MLTVYKSTMSLVVALCMIGLGLQSVKAELQPSVDSNHDITYPRVLNFSFAPEGIIQINEGEFGTVHVNYTCESCSHGDHFGIVPTLRDKEVGTVHNFSMPDLVYGNNWRTSGSISFRGGFLGKTILEVLIVDRGGTTNGDFTIMEVYRMHALRQMVILDFIFIVVIALLVGINTIAYACTLDLDIVKAHIKKPIGISIGFCCQYLFMPVTAFLLGYLFNLEDSLAFGLLCYGASPGGGASNVWTILLRGDLNLSVSMTFISITSSLAMTSLWLFTLGRTFTGSIKVPYHNIIISLVSLLATVIIGLLIKRFAPRVAKVLAKIIKPMAAVIIIYILTFGTYTNLYIFRLMNSWQVVVSAMLVSYIGYLLSFISALLFRRSWKVIRTIVIETGIQNGALAILIVKYSLPQPDGDLATVAPATALMTNGIPLIIAFIVQCIYRKCQGKPLFRSSKEEEADESDSDSEKSRKTLPTKYIDPGAINNAFSPSSSFHSSMTSISGTINDKNSSPSLAGSAMLHFLSLPQDGTKIQTQKSIDSSGYDSQTLSRSSRLSVSSAQDRMKGLEFESVV